MEILFLMIFKRFIAVQCLILGSLNALSQETLQYVKPHQDSLVALTDRHLGWRITTGSYFLIPYKHAFQTEYPKDWSIFLSFKANSFSQVRNKTKSRKLGNTFLNSTFSFVFREFFLASMTLRGKLKIYHCTWFMTNIGKMQ